MYKINMEINHGTIFILAEGSESILEMDLAVDISTGLPHDHEEVVHVEGPGPVVDLVEEVLDLDVSGVLPGSSHGVLKGLNKHTRNFGCFIL